MRLGRVMLPIGVLTLDGEVEFNYYKVGQIVIHRVFEKDVVSRP